MATSTLRNKHSLSLVSICLLDDDGTEILNSLVCPKNRIRNYCTWIHGITDKTLQGKTDERTVIQIVHNNLNNKILVGSGLTNDMKVLKLTNLPHYRTFDLANSSFLREVTGITTQQMSLKNLTNKILNTEIQTQNHSAYQDTVAIFKIFNKYRKELTLEWSQSIPK